MINRTNTGRYVALCDVADCGWSDGPHGKRILVSERLRAHMKVQHGLMYVLPTEGTTNVKVQKDTELPESAGGPKLGDFAGQLVVMEKGWREPEERQTTYGKRKAIEVTLGVYDPAEKKWEHHSGILVFSATVIKRLVDAGNDDDLGGVLVQGTERNSREWDLVPPNAANEKLLAKYVSSEEPF